MYRLPGIIALHTKTLKNLANQYKATLSISSSAFNFAKPDISYTGNVTDEIAHKQQTSVNTHDREISLFGPMDARAPLPGNIGVAETNNRQVIVEVDKNFISTTEDVIEQINDESSFSKQYKAVEQFVNPEFENPLNQTMSLQQLECVAHECPELLLKDFKELFPTSCFFRPELTKKLTVITICQKTENDMRAWTGQVDEEREELMDQFVVAAKQICKYLTDSGFWADFIDPSSGRPYLGEYTNATMFETDDRYRNFGFTIEDLGCCKVISHHLWGTNAFVGALFTSATIASKEVKTVLVDENLVMIMN